jgi:hypothetical protein
MWWMPAGFLAIAGAVFGWMRLQRPKLAAEARFKVPDSVNPFTVLGLLRSIQSNNGLAAEQHKELSAEIQTLEQHYFGEAQPSTPDLNRIAEHWVGRAR